MTVISDVQKCLATLEGIEASLSLLAIDSREEKSQQLFHDMMLIVGQIRFNLEERIQQLEVEEPTYVKT